MMLHLHHNGDLRDSHEYNIQEQEWDKPRQSSMRTNLARMRLTDCFDSARAYKQFVY